MVRELTRATILLILTFLVATFAAYYPSNDDTNVASSASEKTDNAEEIKMELNGAGSEQSSGKVVANSKEKNAETDSVAPEFTRRIRLQMAPLMKMLALENKTAEEVKRETYVDFSTLDPNTIPADGKMRAKVLLNVYANMLRHMREPAETFHPSDCKKYDLRKFNNGIVALGVENFMAAATQFCEEEAVAAGETPIVSIGSGDGTVEKEIIAHYRQRFGKEIRIQLVDPDPKFDGIVDFKTVDHLIAENPRIVGNCVAFIIWPNPVKNPTMQADAVECYDIEAIRKLQPKAALTVYDSTGASGSNDFRNFLHEDSLDELSPEEFGIQNWVSKFHFRKKESYGLDNYAILEVARQKITLPGVGTYFNRMVKIVRKN